MLRTRGGPAAGDGRMGGLRPAWVANASMDGLSASRDSSSWLSSTTLLSKLVTVLAYNLERDHKAVGNEHTGTGGGRLEVFKKFAIFATALDLFSVVRKRVALCASAGLLGLTGVLLLPPPCFFYPPGGGS
mgnify:CR=1 FL=1